MKLPLWRISEFIEASGNFDREQIASGYSIDSRTIGTGDLFFAVKGERLDGHDFVTAALKSGAIDYRQLITAWRKRDLANEIAGC